MEIEQAVLNEILETTAIIAFIGTRVHYVKAPQDEVVPYLVIQSVSKVPVRANFAAASGRTVGRIQISILAATYAECKAIAAAIKTVFDGFKGEMGGTGGRVVGGCFLENEYDLPWDVGLSLYGIGADYMVEP